MSAKRALAGVQAIILDIEGTTTPITFVYNTLFPFARNHLRSYLEIHCSSPECVTLLDQLREEYGSDQEANADVPAWDDTSAETRLASIDRYVNWLIDRDRKSRALKELQGRIWEEGYRTGDLTGEVFADVAPALERWCRQGIDVGIFSSGSVLAQQLLFRHSSAGDLTRFLRWYFDTRIGAKTEVESYRRIATTVGIAPIEILFVSDVTRELDAARSAGLRTVLSLRPGNAALLDTAGHMQIRSFDELSE